MVTSLMSRENLRQQSAFDTWSNVPLLSSLSRWVEFDFENPHLYRLMERDEASGIESAQFYYLVTEHEFKYTLLSSAGRLLDRFTSLNALKSHACFLLSLDRIGAKMAFVSR